MKLLILVIFILIAVYSITYAQSEEVISSEVINPRNPTWITECPYTSQYGHIPLCGVALTDNGTVGILLGDESHPNNPDCEPLRLVVIATETGEVISDVVLETEYNCFYQWECGSYNNLATSLNDGFVYDYYTSLDHPRTATHLKEIDNDFNVVRELISEGQGFLIECIHACPQANGYLCNSFGAVYFLNSQFQTIWAQAIQAIRGSALISGYYLTWFCSPGESANRLNVSCIDIISGELVLCQSSNDG
ncbi:MAG: hypothetical protein KAW14_14600 [Candidatus Aegiribacteria sp.]|nr:hypothetical protein [Candidatus Aegiribacteria sp.]